MYFSDALSTARGLALPMLHSACFTLSSTASSSSVAESNRVPTICARFEAMGLYLTVEYFSLSSVSRYRSVNGGRARVPDAPIRAKRRGLAIPKKTKENNKERRKEDRKKGSRIWIIKGG